MKFCPKCEQEKPIEDFAADKSRKDGKQVGCRSCYSKYYKANKEKHAENGRVWRDNNRERVRELSRAWKMNNKEKTAENNRASIARNPGHHSARSKVNTAIMNGTIIKPVECEQCGGVGPIEGHHEDYSRQLDVVWLCRPCHAKRHRELRKATA
jgi:formylmethanofuran dehydrogenase subunit E